MVRPPCCNENSSPGSVKKGPWTPEEDIILVSYIQEHGPGNWRTVPANTGLSRCSKSCRLRWTNYLRPGIKRGNFTEQEEKLIIHLQALLGNRWAAIASYLPQRTDNDIKNYWNTHLRKKMKKLEGQDGFTASQSSSSSSVTKGQWERRLQTDIHMAKQALSDALCLDETKPNIINNINSNNYYNNNNNSFFGQNRNSPHINMINGPSTSNTTITTTTTITTAPPPPSSAALYASSSENIAKLLQGWMKDSPKSSGSETSVSQVSFNNNNNNNHQVGMGSSPSEGFDSIFGFNSPNSGQGSPEITNFGSQGPLSLIEKWLLEDGTGQGHGDLVDMSMVGDGHGLF